MTSDIYNINLIATASLLTYFGVSLLFGKVPNKLKNGVYEISQKLMGCAFSLIALSVIIFFIFNLKNLDSAYRFAYNLSFYYIVSIVITASFVTMIGAKPNFSRPTYKHALISLIIYIATLWIPIVIGNKTLIKYSSIFGAVALFAAIISQTIYFFKRYREALKKGEYFYSEGLGIHINWMIRCIYYIFGIGIFSAVFAFSTLIPKWVLVLYLACFISVCIYTYRRFVTFVFTFSELTNKSEVAELIPQPKPENQSSLSPEVATFLEKQIAKWIEAKAYCKNSVTIISLASEISTNRQYLSNYINSTYKCSFRIWISKLRVDEAKNIMLKEPNRMMTEISERVGFASLTSFIHAFNKAEGLSPKKWHEINVRPR